MTYDNVKSHKNRVFIVSLEDTIFAKSQGEEEEGQGREAAEAEGETL